MKTCETRFWEEKTLTSPETSVTVNIRQKTVIMLLHLMTEFKKVLVTVTVFTNLCAVSTHLILGKTLPSGKHFYVGGVSALSTS